MNKMQFQSKLSVPLVIIDWWRLLLRIGTILTLNSFKHDLQTMKMQIFKWKMHLKWPFFSEDEQRFKRLRWNQRKVLARKENVFIVYFHCLFSSNKSVDAKFVYYLNTPTSYSSQAAINVSLITNYFISSRSRIEARSISLLNPWAKEVINW